MGVSVGACKLRMLYTTELFDVFVLAPRNTAILVLGISHSAVAVRVLVAFTLTKSVFYAHDALVNGALCAGHIDVINVRGRELVAARLELLAVGRASETETSRGPSETQ
eukprot:2257668-Pyramimonas_sp.AAC.1